MIDPHVHLRDWNEKDKETIYHGFKTALKCGFNVLFDMPNTNPPLTNKVNALKRLEDGEKAVKKLREEGFCPYYSIYLGIENNEEEIEEMVSLHSSLFPRVCGLKLFASQSTGNMGIVEKKDQEHIYSILSSLSYTGVLAVHAEKEAAFNKEAKSHSLSRPRESEIESVSDQIEMAVKYGFKGNLHIAHISTKGALDLVREVKRSKELKITTASTPHHSLLTLNDENYIRKMNPPLREKEDRDSILSSLFDGTIDFCESDHAPHTLRDKENGKSGIPGFEGMLILIQRLREMKMSEERINELFVTGAVKAFSYPFKPTAVPLITEDIITEARNSYPFSPWSEEI